MNSDQFEGKWKQLKGSVKQRWGRLTDDDITALSGKKDELIGKIQERYGISREQAEREELYEKYPEKAPPWWYYELRAAWRRLVGR